MRTIKFRAWDKENKDWIKQFNVTSDGRFSIGNGGDYSNKIVLMQFTGLLDKNGKEIWEGDIVRCGKINEFDKAHPHYGKTGVVTYRNAEGAWVVEDKAGYAIANLYGFVADMWNEKGTNESEIIGNIYENPSLLK